MGRDAALRLDLVGRQTGGDWEYIRFHIPTYIGSGLSGQPNISSDMDGIFGGGTSR